MDSVNKVSLDDRILQVIDQNGSIPDTGVFCQELNIPHDDTFIGPLKRLELLEMVVLEKLSKNLINLTKEGTAVADKGSPEYLLVKAVNEGTTAKGDVEKLLGKDDFKKGFGAAMKRKWISMDKATQALSLTHSMDKYQDVVRDLLLQVKAGQNVADKDVTDLKKRTLVATSVLKTFKLTKGPKFAKEIKKQATDVTADMLKNGAWKTADFKPYNFNAKGRPIGSGHLHPLMKVRQQFREIFLEMGFEEMPTNNFVENSFWNFDALFQPQQHPARDAHDTFFLTDPSHSKYFPAAYLRRVQEMHQTGGHGSIGWRYDWKLEESKKNILRTHTTAISSRMLYKLAQEGFRPKKYFSIDRVFRNESLDATHLAEFHQIEGLVADHNLTLGNLMGIIAQFFHRYGIKPDNLRFKPAYNPYTEPSMEIFSYHEGLKKWVEIGNSGVFRPEMLRPMGLPEDVSVIAWGLSLERPTMIKYGYDNIRDLCGHKVKLEFVETNPICRFD